MPAHEQCALAHFLYRDQIRHLQGRGIWPEAFRSGNCQGGDRVADAGGGYGGYAGGLHQNENHRWREESLYPPSEDEDDGEEEGEEEGGEEEAVGDVDANAREADASHTEAAAAAIARSSSEEEAADALLYSNSPEMMANLSEGGAGVPDELLAALRLATLAEVAEKTNGAPGVCDEVR